MGVLKGYSFPLKTDKVNNVSMLEASEAKAAEISAVLHTDVGERVHRPSFGNKFKEALFKTIGTKRDEFIIREVNRSLLSNVKDVSILDIKLVNSGKTTDIIVTWEYNGIPAVNRRIL